MSRSPAFFPDAIGYTKSTMQEPYQSLNNMRLGVACTISTRASDFKYSEEYLRTVEMSSGLSWNSLL